VILLSAGCSLKCEQVCEEYSWLKTENY